MSKWNETRTFFNSFKNGELITRTQLLLMLGHNYMRGKYEISEVYETYRLIIQNAGYIQTRFENQDLPCGVYLKLKHIPDVPISVMKRLGERG